MKGGPKENIKGERQGDKLDKRVCPILPYEKEHEIHSHGISEASAR